MTSDEHVLSLGKLLGNIHVLEMSLRVFLMNRPGARVVHEVYSTDLLNLPAGSELPESDFTSFAYLSELVDRFNEVAVSDEAPTIDQRVVEVRNTLMHGCVLGSINEFPVHILKFSKPLSGRVCVTINERMTTEWFAQQNRLVYSAVQTVAECLAAKA
ncbi:hypothetical protein [Nitrosomonas sp.]|uniref:hypothetical protein n=1 Tax=Nitrosomonas sp. TaxID=42353 RepID=UPI00374D1CA9